jgi:hypothetical protein
MLTPVAPLYEVLHFRVISQHEKDPQTYRVQRHVASETNNRMKIGTHYGYAAIIDQKTDTAYPINPIHGFPLVRLNVFEGDKLPCITFMVAAYTLVEETILGFCAQSVTSIAPVPPMIRSPILSDPRLQTRNEQKKLRKRLAALNRALQVEKRISLLVTAVSGFTPIVNPLS